MNEYALLVRSAAVSTAINALGRLSPRYGRPRRILVVKLDHLGDVILATPAFRALRDAFPGAAIDVVTRPASRVLLEGGGLVDDLFPYDSPRFHRAAPGGADATVSATRAALLESLRGRTYDWVVELRGDEWTSLELLRTIRPARRFDRGTARTRDWVMRRARALFGRTSEARHEVESNLSILRGAVTPRDESPPLEVPPWPDARRRLEQTARDRAPTFQPDRPYVVLQLGATWEPRAWRSESFGSVAASLRAAYDAQVVVVGGAEDAHLLERFQAGGPVRADASFFGDLSIPEVAALFRGARLFVGSDGGMAHLAAACGTPSVVLFGPQNPARFRPRGPHVTVLHHPVPCYPCAQMVCVRPLEPCVNLVTRAEVLEAVRAAWVAAPAADSSRRPAGA